MGEDHLSDDFYERQNATAYAMDDDWGDSYYDDYEYDSGDDGDQYGGGGIEDSGGDAEEYPEYDSGDGEQFGGGGVEDGGDDPYQYEDGGGEEYDAGDGGEQFGGGGIEDSGGDDPYYDGGDDFDDNGNMLDAEGNIITSIETDPFGAMGEFNNDGRDASGYLYDEDTGLTTDDNGNLIDYTTGEVIGRIHADGDDLDLGEGSAQTGYDDFDPQDQIPNPYGGDYRPPVATAGKGGGPSSSGGATSSGGKQSQPSTTPAAKKTIVRTERLPDGRTITYYSDGSTSISGTASSGAKPAANPVSGLINTLFGTPVTTTRNGVTTTTTQGGLLPTLLGRSNSAAGTAGVVAKTGAPVGVTSAGVRPVAANGRPLPANGAPAGVISLGGFQITPGVAIAGVICLGGVIYLATRRRAA